MSAATSKATDCRELSCSPGGASGRFFGAHGRQTGIVGKIADTFNDIVATNQRMARQLELVGQVVGREGRTRQRVRFGI